MVIFILAVGLAMGLSSPSWAISTIAPKKPASLGCILRATLQFTNPETYPRLMRLHSLYSEITANHGDDSVAAIIAIFRNREFLPENGVLHVVGPLVDFYEWAVPLLVRKDVRIIVSEIAENQMLRRQIRSSSGRRQLWALMGENNPQILEKSGLSFEEFEQAIAKRVWVSSDVTKHHFDPDDPSEIHPFKQKTPVPDADLLLSRLPQPSQLHQSEILPRAKPGGLVWVVTETGRMPRLDGIPLEGDAGLFVPDLYDGETQKGRFLGIDLPGSEAFLYVAPSKKE
ncbi:MAG: hypothetical protein AB1540_13560 [Bdellovibrionota bacterium]